MKHNAWLEQVWLESSTVVCGRPLQPLCLGHAKLLHRIGSPLALWDASLTSTAPEPGPGDLLMAVEICRRKPTHAARWLTALWPLTRAFRHPSALWWRRWVFRRKSALWWVAETNTFVEYLARAGKLPPNKPVHAGGKEAGTPYLLMLESLLLAHGGYHANEVDNVPLGWAVWYYCAHHEREGNIRVEDSMQDWVDREIERLKAEARPQPPDPSPQTPYPIPQTPDA